MRISISSGCLTIIIMLLIMIHCSIINKNYRDIEINGNINDAFTYAVNKTANNHNLYETDNTSEDDVLHNTMLVFNEAFKNSIKSDGLFTISVLYADIDNMIFDIMITDEYNYGFMNRKGKVSCERTVKLN